MGFEPIKIFPSIYGKTNCKLFMWDCNSLENCTLCISTTLFFFFKTKKINKILKMAIWNHSFCGENLYMRWISDSNRWAHGMTSQHDNHFTNSPYGSGGWIWTTVLQIMRLSRWPDFSTPQYISKCFQQDSKKMSVILQILSIK